MRRSAPALACAALLVLLVGCTAGSGGSDASTRAPSPTGTAAPIDTSTPTSDANGGSETAPAPDVAPEPPADGGDEGGDDASSGAEPVADPIAAYLTAVRQSWSGEVPAEDVLLGWGDQTCAALEVGEPIDTIVVDDGSAENNTRAVTAAREHLCPEFATS